MKKILIDQQSGVVVIYIPDICDVFPMVLDFLKLFFIYLHITDHDTPSQMYKVSPVFRQ